MNSESTLLSFGIPRENEERRDGGCAVIYDPNTEKYAVGQDRYGNQIYRLYGGGFEENEDEMTGILREVTEESGLYDFDHIEKVDTVECHYSNAHKKVNRCAVATCILIILKSRSLVPVQLEAHEDFDLVWQSPEELLRKWKENNEEKNFDHWIYFLNKAVARVSELGYK
ncbi:MAG TPA: NUDIX domain-containing protein [Candidatus Paceibacterota bacterium]|nr:NUDIX domain-containing protein [Candidatus Paceibacterota bacterium]